MVCVHCPPCMCTVKAGLSMLVDLVCENTNHCTDATRSAGHIVGGRATQRLSGPLAVTVLPVLRNALRGTGMC